MKTTKEEKFLNGWLKWYRKRLSKIKPKEYTRDDAISVIIQKEPFTKESLNAMSNIDLRNLLIVLNVHDKPIITEK
jgi:hypothetical protein